jgi:exopolysaccharide biosynthesis protein
VGTLLRIFALFVTFLPVSLHASWDVTGREESDIGSTRWTLTEIEVRQEDRHAWLKIIFFPPDRAQWRVVAESSGEIDGVEEAVKSVGGLAGINGGYFERNMTPIGLLIRDGEILHPLQKAKLLSGVFAVRRGRPELKRIGEYSSSSDVSQAIQCGPFLVDHSKPAPGLNATRNADRTFVFVSQSSRWGIGICQSPSLAEMGEILASPELIPGYPITRALNFDGGSSTAFFAKMKDHEISSPSLKEVSNYLVLKEK